jgi:hypothetical protein
VVGTVPDQDLAAALVRWLVPDAVGGWAAGDSVTVSTSTDPTAGIRLHLVHNWSWEEATACATSAVTDLLEGRRYAPGEVIALGPWDVRLLRGDEAGDRRGSQGAAQPAAEHGVADQPRSAGSGVSPRAGRTTASM